MKKSFILLIVLVLTSCEKRTSLSEPQLDLTARTILNPRSNIREPGLVSITIEPIAPARFNCDTIGCKFLKIEMLAQIVSKQSFCSCLATSQREDDFVNCLEKAEDHIGKYEFTRCK